VITTDGPYAETKEALTGFYLLECADLDEAVKLAAQMPAGLERGPWRSAPGHPVSDGAGLVTAQADDALGALGPRGGDRACWPP